MIKLPIGRAGRILSGKDAGKIVKVIDDSEDTGGFFVLTSADEACSSWFDAWVKSEKDLEEYFRQSGWLIEWL